MWDELLKLQRVTSVLDAARFHRAQQWLAFDRSSFYWVS